MFAITFHGNEKLELVERPDPSPGAGELLIAPTAVGICGTDREIFEGSLVYFREGWAKYPIVPGHEWVGEVVEVGAGVEGFAPGDQVTGETPLGCGRCARCRAGDYHLCALRTETGILNRDGAMASRMVFPARAAHHAGGIPARAAALLEPASVALNGARRGAVGGRRVLVAGAGTIGLLAAQCAVAEGAASVVVFEPREDRLALAASLGFSSHPQDAMRTPTTSCCCARAGRRRSPSRCARCDRAAWSSCSACRGCRRCRSTWTPSSCATWSCTACSARRTCGRTRSSSSAPADPHRAAGQRRVRARLDGRRARAPQRAGLAEGADRALEAPGGPTPAWDLGRRKFESASRGAFRPDIDCLQSTELHAGGVKCPISSPPRRTRSATTASRPMSPSGLRQGPGGARSRTIVPTAPVHRRPARRVHHHRRRLAGRGSRPDRREDRGLVDTITSGRGRGGLRSASRTLTWSRDAPRRTLGAVKVAVLIVETTRFPAHRPHAARGARVCRRRGGGRRGGGARRRRRGAPTRCCSTSTCRTPPARPSRASCAPPSPAFASSDLDRRHDRAGRRRRTELAVRIDPRGSARSARM